MRIFGLTVTRQKAQPVQSGSWYRIFESFPGAWQRNISIEVSNVLTNPTVYSCVTCIASDIAKLGLRVVASDAAGIRSEADHPVVSPLFRKPNWYQTRIEFIQHWVMSKLSWGNTYVLKIRTRSGAVESLRVLDPRKVRPMVAENGDVFYELQRDDFSGRTDEVVMVPAREIIHDKMNAIYHPLIGMSPIYAAGLAAVQGLRIQENSANFFSNGARPSGVLTAPGEISQDTANRLKETWQTNFSGEKAGSLAVLGDGLTYEPMMMSSVDAQLIEQLKWSAETICACFRVPAYLAGVGEAPLNNNAQTLRELYYSQCLQIHLEQIEALLDDGLALKGPYSSEFDVGDLLRMDEKSKSDSETALVKGGIKAPNESRKRFNLPPVAGGEQPYMQQQMWPLRMLEDRPMPDARGSVEADQAPKTIPPEDQTERAQAAFLRKWADQHARL